MKRGILPEQRRSQLKKLLTEKSGKSIIRLIEAHSGLSALIGSNAKVQATDGSTKTFDGIWLSGLTDTASQGVPDREILGIAAKLNTLDQITAVSDRPIIVDGDSGGTMVQLEYTVAALERHGASGVVFEDQIYPKQNSLIECEHFLEKPENFAKKLHLALSTRRSSDFMIFARIESFIANETVAQSLERAKIYLQTGVDGIVIHSRARSPEEVFEFSKGYQVLLKESRKQVPLVCIPTSYGAVKESELIERNFQFVIYANFLLRAAARAMGEAAQSILSEGRCQEASQLGISLQDLFQLIDEPK